MKIFLYRICSVLFISFVILSCDKGTSLRNKIYIPYVISNKPDPLHIVYSGDWIATNHLWSTLVDLKYDGTIIGVLAESWTKSSDGLTWTIKLKPNLKWSDGSSISSDQIIESLNVSKNGTSHTNLAKLIVSILKINDSTIEFKLIKNVPQFLEALTYSDWSIMHPSSLNKDENGKYSIKNLSITSGPFKIFDETISMMEKTNVVKKMSLMSVKTHHAFSELKISNGSLVSFDQCDEIFDSIKEVASFRMFKDQLTKECEEKFQKEGFDIFPSQPSWIIKADFSSRALKVLSLQTRLNITRNIHRLLKIQYGEAGSMRATGLRAPHLYGSLSEAEFDEILFSASSNANETNSTLEKVKLKIVTMENWANWKSFNWLVKALKTIGHEVEVFSPNMNEFYHLFASGKLNNEYDLLFLPLGVGDIDPDGSWRIARRYFYPSVISENELEGAYLENDYVKRGEKYKEFSKKLIKEAVYIPLVMNVDFIGVHQDFKIKEGTALRNGTSLFDLE